MNDLRIQFKVGFPGSDNLAKIAWIGLSRNYMSKFNQNVDRNTVRLAHMHVGSVSA